MADFVRRLVSGNKARYKDEALDVELDLAYITDNVIVMGYPASGFEGLYRNRREDAKKFLEHRHQKNFWVFNFCPIKENSYPASVFDGRVSRYPFPDHHAPPLAILALVAREISLWLDASPDRIAVLHCKAGKGRSGTMACSYLLTLDDLPNPPKMGPNATPTERATLRAKQLMNSMPVDNIPEDGKPSNIQSGVDLVMEELSPEPVIPADKKSNPPAQGPSNGLTHVLNLHTAGRMRRPSSPDKLQKPGVSIPSQRRWLYYWSMLLAHQGPPGFWDVDHDRPSPKVRIVSMKLRIRELSGVKANLLRVANAVLDRTSMGKATAMRAGTTLKTEGQIWVSIARYDDELVETLEKWEKHTRDEDGNLGRRKKGSDQMDNEKLAELFKSDKWDKSKMVRSFARLGTVGQDSITHEETEGKKVYEHTLRPLTGERWESLKQEIEADEDKETPHADAPRSEEGSMDDLTKTLSASSVGVVVDANRELRVKLYIGQVFMGWFWFIPTFHMTHPRESANAQQSTWRLKREELDFPLGLGSNIVDLEVLMEWCSESADILSPPERQTSAESRAGKGEPSGIMATLQAASAGNVHEAVEARQAAED